MNFFVRHAYDIGCGAAALLWPFFRKRRALSIDNILRAKIVPDRSAAARLAKIAFCHFAGHIAEAIAVPSVVNAANWREHIETQYASPKLIRLLTETPEEPILMVSGHHGCWEAATNILSIVRPMMAIARVMNNPFAQRWMAKHHFRGPVTLVNKNEGFSRGVMDQWRATKAGLAILTDQFASHGARLTFFGRPARTVTSAARLAIRTGCPMAVGSFVRVGPFKYRILGGDPLIFGPETSREEASQQINDLLEGLIRQFPEQYLWAHRRWRDD